MTCRSTVITTVFCILLLVTTPTFSCRFPCLALCACPPAVSVTLHLLRLGCADLALTHQCFYSRDPLAQLPDGGQMFRLAARHLEFQPEELVGKLAFASFQLGIGPFPHFFCGPLPSFVLLQLHELHSTAS